MTRNKLRSIWDRAIDALFCVGASYLVLIVCSTVWEVLARSLDFYSPIWLSTFAEFGMVIAAMMAAPKLVRDRGHVSMELIDAALSDGSRKRLIFLTDFVAAAISLVVCWYCAVAGWDSFARGEVDIQTVDIPRWFLFAVLALGFLACSIEFVRHVFGALLHRKDDVERAS